MFSGRQEQPLHSAEPQDEGVVCGPAPAYRRSPLNNNTPATKTLNAAISRNGKL